MDIHLSLINITHNIFWVLTIINLVNQYGEPTTPHKLETGMKPLVWNTRVLFYSCDLQKSTARFDRKALNMRHQSQKRFWGIIIGIPQHLKGFLVYVPSARK